MMDHILDSCEWVIRITDDIIIHDKDDEEHDSRLYKFIRIAKEHGLGLNKSKSEAKRDPLGF